MGRRGNKLMKAFSLFDGSKQIKGLNGFNRGTRGKSKRTTAGRFFTAGVNASNLQPENQLNSNQLGRQT
jgi:hypothetical protein